MAQACTAGRGDGSHTLPNHVTGEDYIARFDSRRYNSLFLLSYLYSITTFFNIGRSLIISTLSVFLIHNHVFQYINTF